MNITIDYLHGIPNPNRLVNPIWQNKIEVGESLTVVVPLGTPEEEGGWQPGEWAEGFPRNTFFLTPFLRGVSETDSRPTPIDPVITVENGIITGVLTKTAFEVVEIEIP